MDVVSNYLPERSHGATRRGHPYLSKPCEWTKSS